MDTATFNTFLVVMAVTALIVFIALHFINAGYGMLFDKKWGASLSNRIGWIVMEAPVFIAMIFLWIFATDEYRFDPIRITFLVLFQIPYFHSRVGGRSVLPPAGPLFFIFSVTVPFLNSYFFLLSGQPVSPRISGIFNNCSIQHDIF